LKNSEAKQKNNNLEGDGENLSPSKISKEKLHRKCIACGEFFDRKNMIRIMKQTNSNEIIINPDNKTFGRSAYLCKNIDCLNFAIKKNRFPRALRIKIDSNVLEKLKIMIN
jgi:predicted RNA-binding protein YlxR (DUF448 family)